MRDIKEAIREANLILTVTNAITTIINLADLSRGSILCDVSYPANVNMGLGGKRNDVLVFEGGLSRAPFYDQIKSRKWNILMPTNGIYGCLAEGLILGFEVKKDNYSIGRGNIKQERIDEIWKMADKHGFGLSEFFCGHKFYTVDDITRLSQIVDKNGIRQEAKAYAYR